MTHLQEEIIRKRITDEELNELYEGHIENVLDYKSFDIYKDLDKLKDVDIASNLVQDAIKNNKHICISADYDTDGIPSLATVSYILFNMLKVNKENVSVIVGGRTYGRGVCTHVLNKLKGLKTAKGKDIDLLITIDHGSTDQNSYRQLKEYYPNIKILVTDHHTVEQDMYPISADAFVNVKRPDSAYTKTICGHQTIFLVLLKTHYDLTGVKDITLFEPVLPYVALSTMGDMMPMKYPLNRYLIKYGLQVWNKRLDTKLNTITSALNLTSDISPDQLSMTIAPWVNSGNRLGYESYVVKTFIAKDRTIYDPLIDKIIEINNYRKSLTSSITKTVLDGLEFSNNVYGIVVTIDSPQALVNGVIAGNIAQMYGRPTICFNDFKKDVLQGSGRAGEGNVDVLKIIRAIQADHPNLISSANGHAAAFGISILRDNLDKFKSLFNEYTKNYMPNIPIPTDIHSEYTMPVENLTYHFVKQIKDLAPYGLDFKDPIIKVFGLKIEEVIPIKTFYKVKFKSIDDKISLDGMCFFRVSMNNGLNYSNFKQILTKGTQVVVECNVGISTYGNRSFVSLNILTISPDRSLIE